MNVIEFDTEEEVRASFKKDVTQPEYCTWTQSNILDVYDTSCENEYHFYFMEFQDAGFLFCPYCGKPIKDVPFA
jgi:hypothetical protein